MTRSDEGRSPPSDRPSERQIARAYLRIAHIYRTGGIMHLAAEYYGLVVARFPEQAELAGRARIWLARCLAATGDLGAARRHLRAVVRDRASASALRCHAALRLLPLAARTYGPCGAHETRRILFRRLRRQVGTQRLARWVQIADRIGGGVEPGRGMVAES